MTPEELRKTIYFHRSKVFEGIEKINDLIEFYGKMMPEDEREDDELMINLIDAQTFLSQSVGKLTRAYAITIAKYSNSSLKEVQVQ